LLVAAVEREAALLAGLDASLAADGGDGTLTAIRANHARHLNAIQTAVRGYALERPLQPVTAAPALDRVGLRRAEEHAAQASRTAADRLPDAYAALLASIAACEATHAELLSS
jgi:hypothetical protein